MGVVGQIIAFDHCHHAGFADTGAHFQTKLVEMFGDDASGAHFLKCQFRVLVKISSPGNELGEKVVRFLFKGCG